MLVKRYIEEPYKVNKRNIKVESVVDGKKRISIFGEHQAVNMINKNVRVYTEELWNDLLNRKDFIEAQEANRLLGFLGHPNIEKSTDLDYSKFSHYTKGVFIENNIVYATDYPTTSPMGELLTNYMLHDNIQFGISSRGYGESRIEYDPKLGKHVEYMLPGFVLEGWDFVLDPSCYIAFPKVKLESRAYIENWNPVIEVLRDTVYSKLDELKDYREYADVYKDFIYQLMEYPNQAVVKNYVTESVKPILRDLEKKTTNSNFTEKYIPVTITLSNSKDVNVQQVNQQIKDLANNYNQLLEEYKKSLKIIDKYEKKFGELVRENKRYRMELGDNINSVPIRKNSATGDSGVYYTDTSDDTLRFSDEEVPIKEQPSVDKEQGSSEQSSFKIPIGFLKKLNLKGAQELGEKLSVLSDEKKHILLSAMFNNDENKIKNALYELVSDNKIESSKPRKNRLSKICEYVNKRLSEIDDNEDKFITSRYKIWNKGKDIEPYLEENEEYDLIDEDIEERIKNPKDDVTYAKVKKKSKEESPGNSLFSKFLETVNSDDNDNDDSNVVTESVLFEDEKESEGAGKITIADKNDLVVRKGDTVSNNYIGPELFSNYIESMELTNVNSPIPADSFVMVVKDYEHPASTSHLRRGEKVFYKGYFKGRWNGELANIAVLKVEYDVMGTRHVKYVTMKLEDMYQHVVHVDMSANLRDINLPHVGMIDTDKRDDDYYKAFQVKLEERLTPKPLFPDKL